ncbi:MAG: hypothetical protein NC041_05205 [Bacteroides sp.]|nr:hypothetical protein [Prevotella sp.]MCM1407356.1 hypothetical protein [Treponema brennaborense]MCM1469846.1 hypothetical protein [Bacteroides sp.]
MDKKLKKCAEKLKKLVSDVQGAPYPGSLTEELYAIWYEHIQRNAIECFEFLDENFSDILPDTDIEKTLSNVFPGKK